MTSSTPGKPTGSAAAGAQTPARAAVDADADPDEIIGLGYLPDELKPYGDGLDDDRPSWPW
jgi:hypothetical protein